MVIRVSSILLGVLGVLALIIGVLMWLGVAPGLRMIHILLGIVVVVLLWVVGIGQALSKGGSWPMAIVAVVLGLVTAWLGITQGSMMQGSGHIVIQIVHLLLGLAAIGLGQGIAARSRRAMAA